MLCSLLSKLQVTRRLDGATFSDQQNLCTQTSAYTSLGNLHLWAYTGSQT